MFDLLLFFINRVRIISLFMSISTSAYTPRADPRRDTHPEKHQLDFTWLSFKLSHSQHRFVRRRNFGLTCRFTSAELQHEFGDSQKPAHGLPAHLAFASPVHAVKRLGTFVPSTTCRCPTCPTRYDAFRSPKRISAILKLRCLVTLVVTHHQFLQNTG